MGYRDIRASFAQFNLVPEDPEADRLAQIDRFIEDSVRQYGVEIAELASPFSDANEEWTVVYDKFRIHQR